MRNYLVILPVGDNSLHVPWCTLQERTYDVWIIYYGDDNDVRRKYSEIAEKTFVGKGKKFQLIKSVTLQFREEISKYDYVWFPDDDLRFYNGPDDVNVMFSVAKTLGAECFQPCIGNALEGADSKTIVGTYCSPNWETCLYVPGARFHTVTAIEMMMFGFSSEAFQRCFVPACVLARNSRTGWGIEMLISLLLSTWKGTLDDCCFVLDCVPIIHTRPLGGDPEHNRQGHEDLQSLDSIIRGFERKTLRVTQI